MKKLFILSMALVYLFGADGSALAQEGMVSATVRPNPLKVKTTAPSSVSVRQWFDIKAEVSNLGTDSVTKTSALVSTSSELKVRGKRKRIGNLAPGATETVTWRARANSSGNFLILVEANGRLVGEKISASDSTIISANGFLGAFLFKLIFGV